MLLRSPAPLLAFALVGTGCPAEEPALRVGVGPGLEELGLGRWVAAGLEGQGTGRVELVALPGGALAPGSALDLVLAPLDERLERAAERGRLVRVEPLAHEELVWIGPEKNLLGKYAHARGAELLRNIARTHHRLLMGAEGTPERRRLETLFRGTGDRDRPGSWFPTEHEGRALVRAAVERSSFALVRRSSLLLEARNGARPARIWAEGDPALVLVVVAGAVAGSEAGAKALDWLASEAGRAHVAGAAGDRLGHPLLAPGAPRPGQPADGASIAGWAKERMRPLE